MGWKKVLIFGLVTFNFFSCYNYYHHPDGGYRPKKPKFQLKNSLYKSNLVDGIKTDVIYFSNDTLKYGEGDYNDLFYFRFFNNGRFYKNSVDIKEMRNIERLNRLGFVGYYNIKDSLIEMEYFFVKYKERGWYQKSNGYIKNDTLFIKGTDKHNKEVLRVYIPKKVKGLRQTTDW